MNKTNSFQDFLACAKYLVDHKFAQHDKLAAWGISAGGLLLGATINMCPNLFRTVILEVSSVLRLQAWIAARHNCTEEVLTWCQFEILISSLSANLPIIQDALFITWAYLLNVLFYD